MTNEEVVSTSGDRVWASINGRDRGEGYDVEAYELGRRYLRNEGVRENWVKVDTETGDVRVWDDVAKHYVRAGHALKELGTARLSCSHRATRSAEHWRQVRASVLPCSEHSAREPERT